jgi:hypothetical protein
VAHALLPTLKKGPDHLLTRVAQNRRPASAATYRAATVRESVPAGCFSTLISCVRHGANEYNTGMPADFEPIFATLKAVLATRVKKLAVKNDTPSQYTLLTKSPSPYPQHKGQPMWFAEVRLGKAYVSFHLMPLYMNPALASTISPELKKRMQGKTCFNFKNPPDAGQLAELNRLTEAALRDWGSKNYL